MTHRPKPKYASRDATHGPWVTCGECGLLWSQCDMAFQFDFQGGPVPINLNLLRCPKCITPYTWQRKLLIIPPDPPPFFNTRPENYTVDETQWLTTQDGDILTTQSGDDLITSIPNPDEDGNTTHLTTDIPGGGGS